MLLVLDLDLALVDCLDLACCFGLEVVLVGCLDLGARLGACLDLGARLPGARLPCAGLGARLPGARLPCAGLGAGLDAGLDVGSPSSSEIELLTLLDIPSCKVRSRICAGGDCAGDVDVDVSASVDVSSSVLLLLSSHPGAKPD